MSKTSKRSTGGSKKSTSARSGSKKSIAKKPDKKYDIVENIVIDEDAEEIEFHEITYKNVDPAGKYRYANYGGIRVIMMMSNEYINATKLCALFKTKNDTEKKFKHWKENDDNKQVIDHLSSKVEKSTFELFIRVSGGRIMEITGTYVHPLLINSIAMWASPEYSIEVAKVMNNYNALKERIANQAIIAEKEEIIQEKDDKIDELKKMIAEMRKENQEAHQKNDANSKKLGKKIDKVSKKNDKILKVVKTVARRSVPSTGNKGDDAILVIIQNNDVPVDGKIKWSFSALRLINNSYSGTIAGHKKKHKKMIEIKKMNCEPNAINVWKRAKRQLIADKVIKSKGCGFDIIDDEWNVNDVIDYIQQVSDEKYDIGIDEEDSDDDSEDNDEYESEEPEPVKTKQKKVVYESDSDNESEEDDLSLKPKSKAKK